MVGSFMIVQVLAWGYFEHKHIGLQWTSVQRISSIEHFYSNLAVSQQPQFDFMAQSKQ